MEAKVDVRKLQLLNDRITQTIEALNQVRLSVHGLAHTPAAMPFAPPQIPFTGYGFGMTPSFPQFPGIIPPPFGLQHTPFIPQQTPFIPQQMPFVPPLFGLQHTPFVPQAPFTPFTPFTPFPVPTNLPGITPLPWMSGLSHTSPDIYEQKLLEIRALDPYRMVQTFPFLNSPSWTY